MKKSITLLALLLVGLANANTIKLEDTVTSFRNKEVVPETKFVSHADPNLIQSELGTLKKSPKSLEAIIAEDLKVTDAVVPAKISLKIKKQKVQPVTLKNTLQN